MFGDPSASTARIAGLGLGKSLAWEVCSGGASVHGVCRRCGDVLPRGIRGRALMCVVNSASAGAQAGSGVGYVANLKGSLGA